MKKKTSIIKAGLCFLGIFAATAMINPFMQSEAKEGSFVTWRTVKKNVVGVSLCLQQSESIEEVYTFQTGFLLEGDVEDVKFMFSSGIKGNPNIPVKEYLYDDETQILTVYVSGRETVLEKTVLDLGKISVEGSGEIEISLVEDLCNTVDRFHTMKEVSEMGAATPYSMNLSANSTDPTDPTDPSEPETTAPRYDDDDDSDSGTPGTWRKSGVSWKFLKADGTEARNEWVNVSGKWYKLNAEGIMESGWILENGVWYHCGTDGAMDMGWIQVNGFWYHLRYSGAMDTGWIYDKSDWYYLKPDGSMKTGWVESGGKWYYMDETGRMLSSTVTPDGYQLDKNGVWIHQ